MKSNYEFIYTSNPFLLSSSLQNLNSQTPRVSKLGVTMSKFYSMFDLPFSKFHIMVWVESLSILIFVHIMVLVSKS